MNVRTKEKRSKKELNKSTVDNIQLGEKVVGDDTSWTDTAKSESKRLYIWVFILGLRLQCYLPRCRWSAHSLSLSSEIALENSCIQ